MNLSTIIRVIDDYPAALSSWMPLIMIRNIYKEIELSMPHTGIDMDINRLIDNGKIPIKMVIEGFWRFK